MSSSPVGRASQESLSPNLGTTKIPFFQDSPTPSPTKGPSSSASRADVDSQHDQTQEFEPAGGKSNAAEFNAASDSEDSDDGIRRPIGRAARRMLGGSESPDELGKQQSKSPSPCEAENNPVSDDDDFYSATPRKARKQKSLSPTQSGTVSTLFVSPAKSTQEDSEHDLPSQPIGSKEKLAALVAEKRAERLAKEAEENEQRKQRSGSAHASSDLPEEVFEGSQDPVDPDVERIMSDATKPTRKASKRAMLEMERETQRMSRQQALAHQMKTKKKFSMIDLFSKFNYHPAGETDLPPPTEGDTTASSAPNSDAVESIHKEPVTTPPSSPPTPLDRQRALVEIGALSKLVPVRQDSLVSLAEADDDEELHDLADIPSSSRAAKSAIAEPPAAEPEQKRGLKLARLGKKAMAATRDDSSDDELEIIQAMPAHLSVFDKAKGTMKRQHTDSTAIHTLKHLSHIGQDYGFTGRRKKGGSRPSVNPQVLEAQLRMRAKEQARAQQLQRIADLKAKGIEVPTAEEREREAEQFENLLEKARTDAVELRKAEKAAAKGDVDAEGNTLASDDESEDEDYVDGSENDDVEMEGIEKESNEMVDDPAEESEDEEEDADEEQNGEEGEAEDDELAEERAQEQVSGISPTTAQPDETEPAEEPSWIRTPIVGRKPRKSHIVLDDDEDESDVDASQQMPQTAAETADGDNDDPFAAFNFGSAKHASSLMSPTQAFNATMQTPTQATQQESLDILRHLVPPTTASLPPVPLDLETQTQDESQASIVPSSQLPESQQINLLWETQAPETPVPGMKRGGSNLTLETPGSGWQPTQDAGLPTTWQATPRLRRENTLESMPDNDTQSTVRLRISESPAPSRMRGRLIRGKRAQVDSSDDEDEAPGAAVKDAEKDAFREMARKRKEALTAAERADAEREAKKMMDEQAEESEDEYAGLGGDDFIAPENEEDREMIDSSHIDVNERELAAHFAERQRVADEAEATKLYKDLMTGGLRRKQANVFDLDDDEDDIALRRRQARQREEARKRKLLLQDDNIAGLAEGKQTKGKDAFLKAIADDDDRDDEILDLSDVEEEGNGDSQTESDSQPSQQPGASAGPLREVSGNKRRFEDASQDRPPAKQRRTQASAFRAPTSLLELQESVSFLLDEPLAAMVGPTVLDISSESEDEDEEPEQAEDGKDDDAIVEELSRQNDGGFAPDRVAMPPPRLPASQRRTAPKPAVVDRLSLKRGSSTSDGAHGRTAWAAPANGGFKAASLLRRATTTTVSGANDRGVTSSNGISRENSGVRMGGTKKSSLAYQARAEERKAIVEASAKRRQENTARIATLRRAASRGFGKGMSGRFE